MTALTLEDRPALSLALMAWRHGLFGQLTHLGQQDRVGLRLGPLELLAPCPALSISCFWRPSSSRIPFWATFSASMISASEISSEPPSTITIESAEPLTTRSMLENSSCWKVGFRIQFPSTRPTRTAASGPFQGTARETQCGGGRDHAEHVGVVLLVGREDGDEDLHLVLESLRKEGPDRAVDQTAGQNLLVRRAALALEKSARDLARRRRSSRGIRRSGGRTGGWRRWGRRSLRPGPSCRRSEARRSRRPALPCGRSRG